MNMQTIPVSSPNDIYAIVKDVIQILIIPFCIYVVTSLRKVEKKVDTVNQTLVGQDGKNGLLSRVRRLEKLMENLRLGLARHLNIHTREIAEPLDETES